MHHTQGRRLRLDSHGGLSRVLVGASAAFGSSLVAGTVRTGRAMRGLCVLVAGLGLLLSADQATAQTTLRKSYNDGAKKASEEARYADAEKLYRTAIREAESAGVQDSTLAVSLDGLAGVFLDVGKFPEAEPLYKRALKLHEETSGADSLNVSATLNNLAVLYQAQAKYAEAEPLLKRSLAIDEQKLPVDDPSIATACDNLASLYQSQRKYAEAEPLYKRALTIKEQKLGADHRSVGISCNNLAMLYLAQGKYAEAEPLLKRSLTINEQKLDANHPEIATTCANLALLYKAQGKYAEAEPLYILAVASCGLARTGLFADDSHRLCVKAIRFFGLSQNLQTHRKVAPQPCDAKRVLAVLRDPNCQRRPQHRRRLLVLLHVEKQ
jgi:tetratricopeptide (TPR) repeat protein